MPRSLRIGDGELRVVSMGFLAEEDQALLWRGLVLNKAVQQFIEDTDWSGIDYLLVDLPPGTSDVPMGLARTLPQTGLLLVTTPPLAAQLVAARAGDFARRANLRVLGVIENMSSFECEHGTRYELFGSGGGARLAEQLGVELLASIPFDATLGADADDGGPPVARRDRGRRGVPRARPPRDDRARATARRAGLHGPTSRRDGPRRGSGLARGEHRRRLEALGGRRREPVVDERQQVRPARRDRDLVALGADVGVGERAQRGRACRPVRAERASTSVGAGGAVCEHLAGRQ